MAAGMGVRFGRYTEYIPKGFVEVGGQPMVVRSIEIMRAAGIRRIIIGTGYQKEAYEQLAKDVFPEIECCFSPRFAETNSMYTLYNCCHLIGNDDFLLLESDLIFDSRAITELLALPQPDVMLIAPVTKFQDQYYVEHDGARRLTRCSVNKSELDAKGELVGVHKLSNSFYRAMCTDYARIAADQPKLGYEYELLHMSQHVMPVHVHKIDGLHWYEIDDESDLKYAEEHVVPNL